MKAELAAKCLEMIRDVDPGANFDDLALTAVWMVMMERDSLILDGDPISKSMVERDNQVLWAFVGKDYEPLMDYARDQLVIISPLMHDKRSMRLEFAQGEVDKVLAAQPTSEQKRYRFWEKVVEKGEKFLGL